MPTRHSLIVDGRRRRTQRAFLIALLLSLAVTGPAAASGGSYIGGNGTQQNPHVFALNRPEAIDGIHSPNGSICWGKRRTGYQQSGPVTWNPVHDSVATCDSVFGTTYIEMHGDDEFRNISEVMGEVGCSVTGAFNPCLMHKVESGMHFGPGHMFIQHLKLALIVDRTVYRIGSQYYRFVWGPPTFFCNWPETTGVQGISCSLEALQVTAGESYTYFG